MPSSAMCRQNLVSVVVIGVISGDSHKAAVSPLIELFRVSRKNENEQVGRHKTQLPTGQPVTSEVRSMTVMCSGGLSQTFSTAKIVV